MNIPRREAPTARRRWRLASLALSLLLCEGSVRGAEANGAAPAPSGARGFSLALMGGVAAPACAGQQLCEGLRSPAPTLEALALWKLTPLIGLGLVAQASRVTWVAPIQFTSLGPPAKLRATLTTGFVAIGVRVMFREARVSPFFTLAIGSVFQVETGSNISTAEARFGPTTLSCNGGFNPTAQLGLGVSGRMSRRSSAFAMATATGGLKQQSCTPFGDEGNQLPHTPIGAWGLALQVGAAFDIGQ